MFSFWRWENHVSIDNIQLFVETCSCYFIDTCLNINTIWSDFLHYCKSCYLHCWLVRVFSSQTIHLGIKFEDAWYHTKVLIFSPNMQGYFMCFKGDYLNFLHMWITTPTLCYEGANQSSALITHDIKLANGPRNCWWVS